MPKRIRLTFFLKNAPIFLGAFFLFSLLHPLAAHDLQLEQKRPHAFTFISYNLRNYLTMNRWSKGQKVRHSKPEEEVIPLINLIIENKPDILGICEIGSPDDLKEFQARLKQAGLDLPHFEYAFGYDETRRLALLSKFPITARNSTQHSTKTHEIEGRTWTINRGILDTTVETPIGPVRFLGVHLKSKRKIDAADESIIRLNEARILRDHIVKVLDTAPATKLIVYGDMNDTRQSAPIKSIIGRKKSKTGLHIHTLRDSQNTTWTQFWAREHVYSRFDWLFSSNAMAPFIDNTASYIPSGPSITIPSDHRPLVAKIFKHKPTRKSKR